MVAMLGLIFVIKVVGALAGGHAHREMLHLAGKFSGQMSFALI